MKKLFLITLFSLVLLTACGSDTDINTTASSDSSFSIDELNKMLKEAEDRAASFSKGDTQPNETSDSNTLPVEENSDKTTITSPDEYDYILEFPSDRYPETALHIYGAIEQGYSDVCTINRAGAEENRKESLRGIDTREGFDRDEWPMAMCEEGGKGASVAYISASDNRGAGSWVGNELSQYENGERILFIVEKPTNLFPNQDNSSTTPTENKENITYNSCAEVREANAAPLKKGDPGYSTKLDRDGDGVACEG